MPMYENKKKSVNSIVNVGIWLERYNIIWMHVEGFFFLPNYSCLVTLIYFVSDLENREIILKANPYFFTWQNTDSVPNYAIVLVSELM